MVTTEGLEFGDTHRIVAKTARRASCPDFGVEPGFRNIHSTDDSVHGNLPCTCDCNQATIRSCVTMAKVPCSSTVVAGGASGDFATPRVGRPPDPRHSRFHRTKISSCRYKGCWTERHVAWLARVPRGPARANERAMPLWSSIFEPEHPPAFALFRQCWRSANTPHPTAPPLRCGAATFSHKGRRTGRASIAASRRR